MAKTIPVPLVIMGPITISGARCGLRDWRPADVAPYAGWQAPEHSWHETNGPYYAQPTAEQRAAHVEQLAEVAAAPPASRPVPRRSLVVVAADDRLIGTVTWHWESAETNWRRMGIALFDPAVRGHGVGTEAITLWTTYLFAATDVRRLDFATYSGNAPMCAIGRKLGFAEEGRFREARAWNGFVYDSVVYGILRDEWMART